MAPIVGSAELEMFLDFCVRKSSPRTAQFNRALLTGTTIIQYYCCTTTISINSITTVVVYGVGSYVLSQSQSLWHD